MAFILGPLVDLIVYFFKNIGSVFEFFGDIFRFVIEDIYVDFFGEIFKFALFDSWQDNALEKLGAILLSFLIIAVHLFVLRLILRAFTG